MLENKTVLEVNGITGVETIRDLSPEEIENLASIKVESDKFEADKQSKIDARQSALAKLAALGLTEEEIAAL